MERFQLIFGIICLTIWILGLIFGPTSPSVPNYEKGIDKYLTECYNNIIEEGHLPNQKGR